jgi:hypothetical protein
MITYMGCDKISQRVFMDTRAGYALSSAGNNNYNRLYDGAFVSAGYGYCADKNKNAYVSLNYEMEHFKTFKACTHGASIRIGYKF